VPEDPYAHPVTGVLHNKLGLSTPEELEDAEREITHAALIFLKESRVSPSYDLRHLCAIHRRIFGDIYDWAGQLRTVAIAKGTWFCLPQYIESSAAEAFRALHGENLLRGLPRDVFTERLTHYLGADGLVPVATAIRICPVTVTKSMQWSSHRVIGFAGHRTLRSRRPLRCFPRHPGPQDGGSSGLQIGGVAPLGDLRDAGVHEFQAVEEP
jgi:hypothetical protein